MQREISQWAPSHRGTVTFYSIDTREVKRRGAGKGVAYLIDYGLDLTQDKLNFHQAVKPIKNYSTVNARQLFFQPEPKTAPLTSHCCYQTISVVYAGMQKIMKSVSECNIRGCCW